MTTFHHHLFLAAAFGLLLGHAPAAASPRDAGPAADAATLQRAVQHQINRHLVFPLFADAASMYGEVIVSYAVDTRGCLVVLSAESSNGDLRNYVVGKLQQVRVGANPSGLWSISHARFIFKPE